MVASLGMASTSTCAAVDFTFGPYAGPRCRGGFDFTLLFEEAILSILPVAIALGLATIRTVHLWKRQIKVSRSKLLYAKLVCFLEHGRPAHILTRSLVRMACIRHVRSDPPHLMGPSPSRPQSRRTALGGAELRYRACPRPSLILGTHALDTTVLHFERIPAAHHNFRHCEEQDILIDP